MIKKYSTFSMVETQFDTLQLVIDNTLLCDSRFETGFHSGFSTKKTFLQDFLVIRFKISRKTLKNVSSVQHA